MANRRVLFRLLSWPPVGGVSFDCNRKNRKSHMNALAAARSLDKISESMREKRWGLVRCGGPYRLRGFQLLFPSRIEDISPHNLALKIPKTPLS